MNIFCKLLGHKFKEYVSGGVYRDGKSFERFDGYWRVSTVCMRKGCLELKK